jgi:hypothetical protein
MVCVLADTQYNHILHVKPVHKPKCTIGVLGKGAAIIVINVVLILLLAKSGHLPWSEDASPASRE